MKTSYALGVLFLVLSNSVNAQEPSMLQIKSMQTRFFEKPFNEVVAAILEDSTNKNFQCRGAAVKSPPPYAPINLQGEVIKGKPSMRVDGWKEVTLDMKCSRINDAGSQEYVWELTPNPILGPQSFDMGSTPQPNPKDIKGTTVRLRIYVSNYARNIDSAQVFRDETYRNNFKNLADALFINAIELTPQVMQ